MNIFRGRPYGRLLRQLDAARHDLITETAKAEEATAKAALAQQRIGRLEAWIKEQDDAHQRRINKIKYPLMPPRAPNYQDAEFGTT